MAPLLGARTLLGAPGLTTRNKLLGAPGLASRNKDATRGSWHRYWGLLALLLGTRNYWGLPASLLGARTRRTELVTLPKALQLEHVAIAAAKKEAHTVASAHLSLVPFPFSAAKGRRISRRLLCGIGTGFHTHVPTVLQLLLFIQRSKALVTTSKALLLVAMRLFLVVSCVFAVTIWFPGCWSTHSPQYQQRFAQPDVSSFACEDCTADGVGKTGNLVLRGLPERGKTLQGTQ